MMGKRAYSFLLDKTVSVERNTPTADAIGGQVNSWANISGAVNVKAGIWQKKRNEKTHEFGKDDGHSEMDWAFEDDLSLRNGDRIVWGSRYFEIVGIPFDWTNDGLAYAPYLVKAMERSA